MVDPDSVTELTNILIKKDDEISQLKAQVTSLTKENESLVYVNRQEVEEKIAPFKVVWEKEIEELKAQVEGLVEALIKVDGHRGTPVGYETHLCRYCGSNHYGANGDGCPVKQALSTLPSTFLEIQKAKDACVETLKKIKENASSTMSFEMIECEAEEALRTLQQAQDLAGQSKKEK